jgi:hypothetical protein
MTSPSPLRLSKKALFAKVGYRPHPGQVLVHRSRAPRRVLCSGVRWGKTKCAAMEALAAAMEPKKASVGWVVAGTYDLAERVYREIVSCVAEHLPHRIVKLREHDKRLILRNIGGGLSEIRAKSADNPMSLLGEGLDWVVIDEAARLKPSVWEAHLSQRLIDKKGWALLISTPKGKGWLYSMWKRGQGGDAQYESWSFPSWTNPLLDREAIEAERKRLPQAVFAQEYEAHFMEGSGQVFRNVRDCAVGYFIPPFCAPADGVWVSDPGREYFAGLDLAKVEDYTVLVIVDDRGWVVFVDRFHRVDWSIQVQRLKVALESYGNPQVFVDSTGKGEPVYEQLLEAGLWATGYTFTARSKAALIDNLALHIERREVVLPTPELAPVVIDELEAFQYSISDSGNVRTGAPSGTHDDCVIALGLALWARSHQAYESVDPFYV